jgi:uncharacterized repeat protein (TIGR01451 family)
MHHITLTPLFIYPSVRLIGAGGVLGGYLAVGWNDGEENEKNQTWMPKWDVTDGLGTAVDTGGDWNLGFTAEYQAGLTYGIDNITITDTVFGSITNQSSIEIIANMLHHIRFTPMYAFPGNNPINAGGTLWGYLAIGYNDGEENEKNLTWAPTWGTTDGLGTPGNFGGDPTTGFTADYTANLAPGYDNITVTVGSTGISNESCIWIYGNPLHHIRLTPMYTFPTVRAINAGGTLVGYLAVGWNDGEENEKNRTWSQDWDMTDGRGSVVSTGGDWNSGFTAEYRADLVAGFDNITITDTVYGIVTNQSAIEIIPNPLDHIELTPMYVFPGYNPINATGTLLGYTAKGWNDAGKQELNLTWSPTWGTTHGLGTPGNLGGDAATGYTADYTANLNPGYDNITVEDTTSGISIESCIMVYSNPLNHIVFTPMFLFPANSPINAGGTLVGYSAKGYNSPGVSEQNYTWSPTWGTTDGLGSPGNFGGDATAGYTADYTADLSPGYDNITITGVGTGISESSCIWVFGNPLHHIELTPMFILPLRNFVSVGGTISGYIAVGWNDGVENEKNQTWNPVWGTNPGLGTAVGTGGDWNSGYTAEYQANLVLGFDNLTITDADATSITNSSAIEVVANFLHHINFTPMFIFPANRPINAGGTLVGYTALGYNDAEEQELNLTWTAAWGTTNGLGTPGNFGGNPSSGFTAEYTAGLVPGYDYITITAGGTGISNDSCIWIFGNSLHHIELIPMYIYPSGNLVSAGGILTGYTAIGWNDGEENEKNQTWTPDWDITSGLGTAVDTGGDWNLGFTAEYQADLTSGFDNITITDLTVTSITNQSAIHIVANALHHIDLTPIFVFPASNPVNAGGTLFGFTAIGYNDAGESEKNYTWIPNWGTTDSLGTPGNFGGDADSGYTADYVAALTSGYDNITVSDLSAGISASSCILVYFNQIHHIELTPLFVYPSVNAINAGGIIAGYKAVGYNDGEENEKNQTWTPVWGTTHGLGSPVSMGGDWNSGYTVEYQADLVAGFDNLTVTDIFVTSVTNQTAIEVKANPLHHIELTPLYAYPVNNPINAGGVLFGYTALGWNDAAELELNLTWIPLWGTSNALGNPANLGGNAASGYTADYQADFVSGYDNITVTNSATGITSNSCIMIISNPLHHITLTPIYVYPVKNPINAGGILNGYTAIGWNDAAEQELNLTWSPTWGTTHGLGAPGNIGGDAALGYSADYTAGLIPGYDNITVSDTSTAVSSSSCIEIFGNPLHHIVLTPEYLFPVNAPLNAGGTLIGYIAVGWNDAGETEINLTWTPTWGTDNALGTPGNLGGDAASGYTADYTAGLIPGYDNITITSSGTGLWDRSCILIYQNPLHHISLTPMYLFPSVGSVSANGIIVGFTAIGWNDANELEKNRTWTPVWDTTQGLGTAVDTGGDWDTGYTASYQAGLVLGFDNITVTDSQATSVTNQSSIEINANNLHHITLTPMYTYPSNNRINAGGILVGYVAIGYNDATELQQNLTWVAVWGTTNGLGTPLNIAGSASMGYTAEYLAGLVPGFDNITVTNPTTALTAQSCIQVYGNPMHHITLIPMYIYPGMNEVSTGGSIVGYLAIGWNDQNEVEKNLTWVPNWGTTDSLGTATNTGGDRVSGFTASYLAGGVLGFDNITVSDSLGMVTNSSCVSIVPGAAYEIVIISGNNQDFAVGTPLPEPLIVEVRDQFGNPVKSGEEVWFNITTTGLNGDGSLSTINTVLTDTTGRAETTLTLDTILGINTVSAEISSLGNDHVTFTAIGRAPIMTLELAVDKVIADPGENIVYTFYFNNTGSGNGSVVWINVTFDLNLIYVSDDSNSIGGMMDDSDTWKFQNISSGSHSFWIRMRVAPGTLDGALMNASAHIDYQDFIGNIFPGSDSNSVSTNVIAPVFSIEKGVDVTHTTPGGIVIYLLHFNNIGSGTSAHVWINDTINPNLNYLSDTSGKNYVKTGDTYSWHFTNVEPGANSFIIITQVKSLVSGGISIPNSFSFDYMDAKKNSLPAITSNSVNTLVMINITNQPPTISGVPDLTVHYDLDYSFDLSPYIEDQDTPMGELVITFSDSLYVRINDTNNMGMILNYPESLKGTTMPLTIYVTDGINSTSQVIDVRITANYPPEILQYLPDVEFDEDTHYTGFDITQYLYDKEGDASYYIYGMTNTNAFLVQRGASLFVEFDPSSNWHGTEYVSFRAEDSTGALIEDTINVTVRPVNDLPIIAAIPEQSGKAGTSWTLDLTQYLSDVDNDLNEMTISTDSPYVTVLGHVLLFEYPEGVENEVVTLTVNDGEDSSSATIAVILEGSKEESTPWILFILPLIIAGLLVSVFMLKKKKKPIIDEVFLIYQDGCLIAHATRRLKPYYDETVLAAMLTAIQDFVKDSFRDQSMWGLNRVSFGEQEIAIERGDKVILAVVYLGESMETISVKMKKIVKKVEEKYKDILEDWDGDMDSFRGVNDTIRTIFK